MWSRKSSPSGLLAGADIGWHAAGLIENASQLAIGGSGSGYSAASIQPQLLVIVPVSCPTAEPLRYRLPFDFKPFWPQFAGFAVLQYLSSVMMIVTGAR